MHQRQTEVGGLHGPAAYEHDAAVHDIFSTSSITINMGIARDLRHPKAASEMLARISWLGPPGDAILARNTHLEVLLVRHRKHSPGSDAVFDAAHDRVRSAREESPCRCAVGTDDRSVGAHNGASL